MTNKKTPMVAHALTLPGQVSLTFTEREREIVAMQFFLSGGYATDEGMAVWLRALVEREIKRITPRSARKPAQGKGEP